MLSPIADLERLLPLAQRETSRQLLTAELARLQAVEAAARPPPPPPSASATPLPKPPPPAPIPQAREVVPSSGPAFSTLSKYAWDQSKKFVKVYLTVKGIEDVPDERVRFDATSDALTFEVTGLPVGSGMQNARLAVRALYAPVDAAQCTWARKADSMILIKLRKVQEDVEWETLDDSAKLKAQRKEEEMAQNKGKTTAGAPAPRPLAPVSALGLRSPCMRSPTACAPQSCGRAAQSNVR